MEMESTRRPFDRSLSKEPGVKKPRLIQDPAASDRISNGRAGFVNRPAVSGSAGGGGSRAHKDRDSESSDSVRGPYQTLAGLQLHQELVTQYKTALAELTFNSKPIITNLTIIAGESLPAAKAIAATVCANIIEVPSEQKLPSLYLLDSIMKNIGGDYIKYFTSRIPEVFCKAYRQVDPSVHSGMRHLFGTWKGVFPLQTLQLIEKELGFTTAANVSGPSRPDSQAQRPAHSIHVNPKYLEARQRMQTSRARGASNDASGALMNSHEDVEALERTGNINSGRSWADPYAAQSVQRHQVNKPARDKSPSVAYDDPEYGSRVSGRIGLVSEKVGEHPKEPGYDRPWNDSDSDLTGMPHHKNGFGLKHGLDSYSGHESANSDLDLRHKQNISSRTTNGMSENWNNSEEYMWNEMNSRPTVHTAADTSAKDQWEPDNYDRLDFDSHLPRHQNIHDIGSRDDDEASADSISMDLGQLASGAQVPSWSQKLHPPDGSILSETGRSLSGYSEGYTSKLTSSQGTVGRMHSKSQLGPAHIGAPSFKGSTGTVPPTKVSMTQERQAIGAPSSTRSSLHQRSPSPSFPSHNPSQLLNNFAERNPTAMGPPTDPRRRPGQKNTGYRDQVSEDSLHLPSRDVYQDGTQKLLPPNVRPSSASVPPIQQRKRAPSTHQRNLEIPEFESSSSSDQSNSLMADSPGKSVTSSLFDVLVKSGIPGSSSLKGSLIPSNPPANVSSSASFRGSKLPSAVSQKKVKQAALISSLALSSSEQMPSAVNSSNPVSSLLSSLVAKGLISSSKSDPLLSASPKIPDQPVDNVPGIASSTAAPVSSVSVTMSKPIISTKAEPSSSEPALKSSDGVTQSTTKIKNLIGFEFKSDVVRKFHPDVISDLLDDLPHQCNICSIRLKLQEQLDRHMEWHALKVPEISRRWYVNTDDWVSGMGQHCLGTCPSDVLGDSGEILESSESMVPADESQCACILCGELFEDFYSQEKNQWMFRGALYLTTSSDERVGPTSDASISSPIVHANCISEDSMHDLGLA
ncbi:hypothetical protein ACS0TY_016296 [Phlomoides rotata]